MQAWELEAEHEDRLGELGAAIADALFGPDRTLRLGDTRVQLSEQAADHLVRALARCSVAPKVPRSPAADPRQGLTAFWARSHLEPDPLPADLGDTADHDLEIIAQVSQHVERLQALAQTHLPEKSRASVDRSLTRIQDTFRELVPDGLLIGARRSNQRGTWTRQVGNILRDAIEAAGAPTPNTDDLGQLVARLLDALSPDQERPADPTSVARLLRDRTR